MDSMKQRSSESRRLIDLIFREYKSYEFFKQGQPVDQANVWLGTEPQVDLVLDAPLKWCCRARIVRPWKFPCSG